MTVLSDASKAPLTLKSGLGCLLVSFLAVGGPSCSGGSGSEDPPDSSDDGGEEDDSDDGPLGGGHGDDGGNGINSLGTIVGELELIAPAQDIFLLTGTLPLPAGVVFDDDEQPALELLDSDGVSRLTQVEIVSRYADAENHGADVVELIARVPRPEGVAPGERIRYQVKHRPHEAGEFEASESTAGLLSGDGSLMMMTWDVFGHQYSADLLEDMREDTGAALTLKDGELLREWASHNILLADEEVDGDLGTMPHMMGVHSFVKQWYGEHFLSLDLRVHNGMSGLDDDDPVDDALDNIYFDRLVIRVPRGWTLLSAYDDVSLGEPFELDGYNWVPIIDYLAGDKLHMLRSQGQLFRRLAIVLEGEEARARAMLASQNLGFCVSGMNEEGADYWSWWNPRTARYFPQNHRLPSFAHVNQEAIRTSFTDKFETYQDHIANGTSNNFPLVIDMQGYARPFGAYYGGMTGGVEVDLQGGADIAAVASRDGYRLTQLTARMYIDREPICLYNANGLPTRVEDWLRNGNHGLYFPGYFNLRPLLPHNDPFGFGGAPDFQNDAVAAQDRQPDYEADLLRYKAIDVQHWTRYTRHMKVLAWLGNDSLAKSEIAMAAEIFRLTAHEYFNSGTGLAQDWGLRKAIDGVAEKPGQGFGFGRASGWGLDITTTAYAMGPDAYRERFYDWFSMWAQLVEDGQSTCGGYLQAQPHHSNDGQYRIRQSYEAGITENALKGVAETIFRGRDNEIAEAIDQVMVNSAYGSISDYFWDNEHGGPHGTVAVGPNDSDEAPYCDHATAVWASPQLDTKYYWNSLAYAYEMTGDEEFLTKAAQMANVGNLFNYFHNNITGDVGNRGIMAAMLQEMEGIY
ncbi:MAG: hypothetical protein ACI835_001003 [Planctomycetota bacterium]|jgi:hypothetical protein